MATITISCEVDNDQYSFRKLSLFEYQQIKLIVDQMNERRLSSRNYNNRTNPNGEELKKTSIYRAKPMIEIQTV